MRSCLPYALLSAYAIYPFAPWGLHFAILTSDPATKSKQQLLAQTCINSTTTRHSKSPTYIMSDKKQEKDFTSEVNELLPQADGLVKVRLCGSARVQIKLIIPLQLMALERNAPGGS